MNMSHEIRTPLNAVYGIYSITGHQLRLAKNKLIILIIIKLGGKRLEGAVTDILEASALQKDQFVVSPCANMILIVILQEVYNKAKFLYAHKLDKIAF